MSRFNTDRHNTLYGGQCIHSHYMDRIRRTGFGQENNDSTRKMLFTFGSDSTCHV